LIAYTFDSTFNKCPFSFYKGNKLGVLSSFISVVLRKRFVFR
jgi:hypothetical protein